MDTAQYWFQAGDAASGYQIERSLRFNSADSVSLSKASYAGAGTFSCWIKRCRLGAAQTIIPGVAFNSSDQLNGSTAVFRDSSAWMHIVVSSTGTYANGVSVASGLSITPGAIGSGCDIYLAEVHFIDGQALTPSSFGEINPVTGVWQPKKYTGTYGTNGFYLKFADNSGTTSTTLGKDSSGNGNNWTPNNFSVTAGSGNDSLIDTPTPYADGGNGRGNYCTWLPQPQQGAQAWTFSNGNLDAVNGNFGSAAYSCIGTIAVSTGKWYWEVTCNDAGPTTLRIPGVGIMGSDRDVLTASATVRPDVYLSGNGTIDNSAGTALQSGFSNMAAGDVVGVALDAGAKTVQFYRNGSAVGTAQSYTPAFVTPSFYSYIGYDCNANFGQRPFAYTPPAGFLALNTQNLPTEAIPATITGMFSGNGSADGPFVYTGCIPGRIQYGTVDVTYGDRLINNDVDFLSNGFKVRSTTSNSGAVNYAVTTTHGDGPYVGKKIPFRLPAPACDN